MTNELLIIYHYAPQPDIQFVLQAITTKPEITYDELNSVFRNKESIDLANYEAFLCLYNFKNEIETQRRIDKDILLTCKKGSVKYIMLIPCWSLKWVMDVESKIKNIESKQKEIADDSICPELLHATSLIKQPSVDGNPNSIDIGIIFSMPLFPYTGNERAPRFQIFQVNETLKLLSEDLSKTIFYKECCLSDEAHLIIDKTPPIIILFLDCEKDSNNNVYVIGEDHNKAQIGNLKIITKEYIKALLNKNSFYIIISKTPALLSQILEASNNNYRALLIFTRNFHHDEVLKKFFKVFMLAVTQSGNSIKEAYNKAIEETKLVAKDSALDICCCAHRHKPDCNWESTLNYKEEEKGILENYHYSHDIMCTCRWSLEQDHADHTCMAYRLQKNTCCCGIKPHNIYLKFDLIGSDVNSPIFKSRDSFKSVYKYDHPKLQFDVNPDNILIGRREPLRILLNSMLDDNIQIINLYGCAGAGKESILHYAVDYLFYRGLISEYSQLDLSQVDQENTLLEKANSMRLNNTQLNGETKRICKISNGEHLAGKNGFKFMKALEEVSRYTKVVFITNNKCSNIVNFIEVEPLTINEANQYIGLYCKLYSYFPDARPNLECKLIRCPKVIKEKIIPVVQKWESNRCFNMKTAVKEICDKLENPKLEIQHTAKQIADLKDAKSPIYQVYLLLSLFSNGITNTMMTMLIDEKCNLQDYENIFMMEEIDNNNSELFIELRHSNLSATLTVEEKNAMLGKFLSVLFSISCYLINKLKKTITPMLFDFSVLYGRGIWDYSNADDKSSIPDIFQKDSGLYNTASYYARRFYSYIQNEALILFVKESKDESTVSHYIGTCMNILGITQLVVEVKEDIDHAYTLEETLKKYDAKKMIIMVQLYLAGAYFKRFDAKKYYTDLEKCVEIANLANKLIETISFGQSNEFIIEINLILSVIDYHRGHDHFKSASQFMKKAIELSLFEEQKTIKNEDAHKCAKLSTARCILIMLKCDDQLSQAIKQSYIKQLNTSLSLFEEFELWRFQKEAYSLLINYYTKEAADVNSLSNVLGDVRLQALFSNLENLQDTDFQDYINNCKVMLNSSLSSNSVDICKIIILHYDPLMVQKQNEKPVPYKVDTYKFWGMFTKKLRSLVMESKIELIYREFNAENIAECLSDINAIVVFYYHSEFVSGHNYAIVNFSEKPGVGKSQDILDMLPNRIHEPTIKQAKLIILASQDSMYFAEKLHSIGFPNVLYFQSKIDLNATYQAIDYSKIRDAIDNCAKDYINNLLKSTDIKKALEPISNSNIEIKLICDKSDIKINTVNSIIVKNKKMRRFKAIKSDLMLQYNITQKNALICDIAGAVAKNKDKVINIYGKCGVGKTHIAYMVCKTLSKTHMFKNGIHYFEASSNKGRLGSTRPDTNTIYDIKTNICSFLNLNVKASIEVTV